MCTLFAIVYGFFDSLEDIIIKMSSMVDILSIPDLPFMELFFLFAIVLFAFNNVFSLYNMEGESRFTISFYFGLQLTIGATIYALVSNLIMTTLTSVGGL
jgi:archaellum biogenesis protein FlaJ (TadC family)